MEMTEEMVKQASAAAYDNLMSNDPQRIKKAEDVINDFTRTKMREDGFYGRILPALPITNDELDRTVSDAKPAKIVDLEPDSPAAISIPFATLPANLYMRARRYLVLFDRIATRKFTQDVDELRTWHMDIRQIVSDNAIRDMLAEEDGKFIRAVNMAVVGPQMIVPTSGVRQYEVIAGGITRDSIADSLRILPNTPSSLETHAVLLNNITNKEMLKWGHNEYGGTVSEDIVKNGWSMTEFMGVKWMITIKKGLVPTNTMYHFADPKFMGKSFVLEDTTMYIRREAYMLEFFAYKTLGGAIANTSSVGRVDFE